MDILGFILGLEPKTIVISLTFFSFFLCGIALMSLARKAYRKEADKIKWVLAIVFLPIAGATAFFIAGSPQPIRK
ncbi:MAG: PLDc N-terminal domain-containing protein [Flammeovirgaceae bacterium]